MASFGENLRRERELRGVSLREVADATKISVRFLQAIEQDRFEILPGGIFRRAFIREYARQIGLDAERLVAEFDYLQRSQVPAEPLPAPKQFQPPYRALAVICLGILVGVAWWAVSGPSTPQEAAAPAATAPSAPVTAATPRVYPAATPAPVEIPATGLVLVLSATSDCWVGVEADGVPRLNRVLRQGESQRIRAEAEILLSVGNAGGVSYTLNGLPGLPLGASGQVRKDIIIDRDSLSELVDLTPPEHTRSD